MHQTFLTKKYNRMFLAGFLGWVICTMGELTDALLSGYFYGENALAGVQLAVPLINVLYFVACCISMGAATVYSIYMGKFKEKEAHNIFGIAVVVALVFDVLFVLALIFGKNAFMNFYQPEPEVASYASQYYTSVIILSTFYIVYWAMYYLVREDGDEMSIFYVDFYTAILGLVLSIFLGKRLGVFGVGLGRSIAIFTSSVFYIFHFLKKNNSLKFRFNFSFSELKKVLVFGSSTALPMLYAAIFAIIMNKYIIDNFDNAFLAVFAIQAEINNMFCMFQSAAEAAGPMISVAYGEHNHITVKKLMRVSSKVALIIGLIATAAFFFLNKFIVNLYGVETPEIFEMATYSCRVMALFAITYALLFEFIQYYPRVGKISLGNLLGLSYMFIAPLVLSLILTKYIGYKGILFGGALSPTLTIIIFSVIIIAKYGIKKFPYILDEDRIVFSHEIKLNDKEIANLCETIGKELSSVNINDEMRNKIRLVIEEVFHTVKLYNKSKRVLADCNIIISDKEIQLILRDNGEVFDITDSDVKIDSLGTYVTALLVSGEQRKSHLVATSFNRNSFIWDR